MSYWYWPPGPPLNRMRSLPLAAPGDATSASPPPTSPKWTCRGRVPIEAPEQSSTWSFTGIVLPSLKDVRPPSGGSRPVVGTVWETWTCAGVDDPPSSSDTTIEIVNKPAPYVWLSPPTGDVAFVSVACGEPSPQSTS